MKKLFLSTLICLLSSGVATASCEENLRSAAPERASLICELEAGLPFVVGERGLGDDLLYFIAKKNTFKGGVKMKHGHAFEGSGKPFDSEAMAERAGKRIAALQGCGLAEMGFEAGISLSFTLEC